ncbi:MAG: creatininase family protein [Chloroflexi bacterium]|nr:creatininase family protein [Chloroflexota bacterium]
MSEGTMMLPTGPQSSIPNPRPSIRLGELTREELRARLPAATVVLPTGSTEQHGPHLPLLTDSLMAEAVALRAAELVAGRADVLVAPLLPYGCSHHHLPVGGALTVSQRTYVALVVELAESLAQTGARRLVLLNGHGGNEDPLRVVANELVYERRLDLAVAAVSYWTLGGSALDEAPGPVPGHAGNFETSCLLALRPELARLEARFPADTAPRPLAANGPLGAIQIRRPGLWEASDGVTDAARDANAEAGARAIETIVQATAEFLLEFHGGPLHEAPNGS